MATMTTAQIEAVSREFQILESQDGREVSLTKSDIETNVGNLDTWIDNNAATINQQLTSEAQSEFNKQQKARLMALVTLKRYDDDV